MRRALPVSLILIAVACGGRAEPRWCSLSGRDPSNKFFYPPIARAARVSGVVLSHLIYTPNGNVQRVEPISGPRLLSDSLAGQLMDWTVKTDAVGTELCQTLVIAEFRIVDENNDSTSVETKPKAGTAILWLSVKVEHPVLIDTVIIDPAPLKGFRLFRSEVKWRFSRAVGWLHRHRAHANESSYKIK